MIPRLKIFQSDVGTQLRITVREGLSPVDLSGATVLKIIFSKPDKTTEERDVSVLTDGTDGIVQFVSTSVDDWDQVGIWNAQLRLAIPGWSGRTSPINFRVFRNL